MLYSLFKITAIIASTSAIFATAAVVQGGLRYKSDSGICETTPNVHQKSGYIDIAHASMWFWFFESRVSPETAPLTLWFNGGPGCSSMMGLFEEHGPCYMNTDNTTTVINPYSWNNVSNVIYIDQPIGVGFSHGNVITNGSMAAASYVWQALQVLFSNDEFKPYLDHTLVYATESYGGHYGPAFLTYVNDQNALIDQGQLQGIKIKFDVLLINNGWIDPLIINRADLDFAAYAPRYGPVQPPNILRQMDKSFYQPDGCKAKLEACYAPGSSAAVCKDAWVYCRLNVGEAAETGHYWFDLRQEATPYCPVDRYVPYLNLPSVQEAIGVDPGITFSRCSDLVSDMFNITGDAGRTMLPRLQALVNSGLKTLIWAGDADIVCNWFSMRDTVLAMDWYGKEEFAKVEPMKMTINTLPVAEVKSLDNFTFAVIYEAGHEIPAYKPHVSFEIFQQIIDMQQPHSVTGAYPRPGPGYCHDPDAPGVPWPRRISSLGKHIYTVLAKLYRQRMLI